MTLPVPVRLSEITVTLRVLRQLEHLESMTKIVLGAGDGIPDICTDNAKRTERAPSGALFVALVVPGWCLDAHNAPQTRMRTQSLYLFV